MSRSTSNLLVAAFALVGGVFVNQATSATINGNLNDNTGYTVSNSDLLQTSFASAALVGDFAREMGMQGETTLRDGTFGPLGGQQGATAGLSGGVSDSVIYTLDTSAASSGYNITTVNTYAGWSYGRYGQAYDLSFHLVGSPANSFTTPISVSYGPNGSSGATGPFPDDPFGNFSTSIAITDISGKLANGVDQVKFVFHASPNFVGDYNGYRELDVFGYPVPEPSSVALLSLGALALVRIARRRRA